MAATIGLAVSALVGIGSAISGQDAAKSARKSELAAIRMQTVEEIRRRTGRFAREASEGLATAGASGFAAGNATEGAAASGGFGGVLKEMQKEFNLEIDWLKRSAAAGIDATNTAYSRTTQGISYGLANSLVGSFNRYGDAKNWWVGPAAVN